MIPEALNNYAHVCFGMIICTMPGLVVAFFLYCAVIMSARADARKEKLLEKKYEKGDDNENYH